MNIFVTGASGRLGGHIAKRLVDLGIPTIAGFNRSPLQTRLLGVDAVQHDFTDGEVVFRSNISVGIHCAAITPENNRQGSREYAQNLVMLKNLYRSLCRAGCRRIIFMSAMSIFPKQVSGEITEDTPVFPDEEYGRSKLECELFLQSVATESQCLILRVPGVVGGNGEGPWLQRLVRDCFRGGPVMVRNPDAIFNNAVWIETLADYVVLNARNDDVVAGTVNIGCADNRTVMELAMYARQKCGSSGPIEVDEVPSSCYRINTTKAKNSGLSVLDPTKIIDMYIAQTLGK